MIFDTEQQITNFGTSSYGRGIIYTQFIYTPTCTWKYIRFLIEDIIPIQTFDGGLSIGNLRWERLAYLLHDMFQAVTLPTVIGMNFAQNWVWIFARNSAFRLKIIVHHIPSPIRSLNYNRILLAPPTTWKKIHLIPNIIVNKYCHWRVEGQASCCYRTCNALKEIVHMMMTMFQDRVYHAAEALHDTSKCTSRMNWIVQMMNMAIQKCRNEWNSSCFLQLLV